MRRKPVIGVSVGYHDFGDYQGVGFQRPIALAGGVPLTLPRMGAPSRRRRPRHEQRDR